MITFTIIIEEVSSGACRFEVKTDPTFAETGKYTELESYQANLVSEAISKAIKDSNGRKISGLGFS